MDVDFIHFSAKIEKRYFYLCFTCYMCIRRIILYWMFAIPNIYMTNLYSWRVEEAPHNVLAPAVGRQMKWGEASLA